MTSHELRTRVVSYRFPALLIALMLTAVLGAFLGVRTARSAVLRTRPSIPPVVEMTPWLASSYLDRAAIEEQIVDPPQLARSVSGDRTVMRTLISQTDCVDVGVGSSCVIKVGVPADLSPGLYAVVLLGADGGVLDFQMNAAYRSADLGAAPTFVVAADMQWGDAPAIADATLSFVSVMNASSFWSKLFGGAENDTRDFLQAWLVLAALRLSSTELVAPASILRTIVDGRVRLIFGGHDNRFAHAQMSAGESIFTSAAEGTLLHTTTAERKSELQALHVLDDLDVYHVADLADWNTDGHGVFWVNSVKNSATVLQIDHW